MSVTAGNMGSLATRYRSERYKNVSRHDAVFVAEQRDTLDDREMKEARDRVAAEAETDKAWRSILQGHDHIRYQIGEMRRALYDMGATLTPRGMRYIEALAREGFKWSDPKPHVSLVDAQKNLLANIDDMRRRWAALKEAEAACQK